MKRRGWHALVGKTRKAAEHEILRLLVDDTVRGALSRPLSENERRRGVMKPCPIFIVADDGFDDTGFYEPVLCVFRQRDLKRVTKRESKQVGYAWDYHKPPLAHAPLNHREWDTLHSIVGDTLDGAGAAAIIGAATLEVEVPPREKKPILGLAFPIVRVSDLEWRLGPEWTCRRISGDAD